MKPVYFKSFGRRHEHLPLETSRLNPQTGTLSICQTLAEVLSQRVMKPNVVHHSLVDRISASRPTYEFPGSYRPEGILFTTNAKPAYCVPFDLMALTEGKTFSFRDYGSDFISGYDQFVFSDFEDMQNAFPTANDALTALNRFRETQGIEAFNMNCAHNEVCFESGIRIKPVALIGTSSEIDSLGLKHRLDIYRSMNDYLDSARTKEEDRSLMRCGAGLGLTQLAAASLTFATLASLQSNPEIKQFTEECAPYASYLLAK